MATPKLHFVARSRSVSGVADFSLKQIYTSCGTQTSCSSPSSSFLHQRADYEALTRLLQNSVFLVASTILVKSMFSSFKSSLTLSIQIFLCLPLLLFPARCPKHCSLLFLIFCTKLFSCLFIYNFFSSTSNSNSPRAAHLCH